MAAGQCGEGQSAHKLLRAQACMYEHDGREASFLSCAMCGTLREVPKP